MTPGAVKELLRKDADLIRTHTANVLASLDGLSVGQITAIAGALIGVMTEDANRQTCNRIPIEASLDAMFYLARLQARETAAVMRVMNDKDKKDH